MCRIILLIALMVSPLLLGCAEKPSYSSYTDITVDEAKELIESGKAFLLDVRTPAEYKEVHIKGAYLIPLNELEDRLDELPKDKPILVYCRTGHRSIIAAEILVKNGFSQVYNMKGGIYEWIEHGYEVESGLTR